MVGMQSATRTIVLAATLSFISVDGICTVQGASDSLDALQQLNRSVESLVTRVSKSVVQVLVTTYGPVSDSHQGSACSADLRGSPLSSRRRSVSTTWIA